MVVFQVNSKQSEKVEGKNLMNHFLLSGKLKELALIYSDEYRKWHKDAKAAIARFGAVKFFCQGHYALGYQIGGCIFDEGKPASGWKLVGSYEHNQYAPNLRTKIGKQAASVLASVGNEPEAIALLAEISNHLKLSNPCFEARFGVPGVSVYKDHHAILHWCENTALQHPLALEITRHQFKLLMDTGDAPSYLTAELIATLAKDPQFAGNESVSSFASELTARLGAGTLAIAKN